MTASRTFVAIAALVLAAGGCPGRHPPHHRHRPERRQRRRAASNASDGQVSPTPPPARTATAACAPSIAAHTGQHDGHASRTPTAQRRRAVTQRTSERVGDDGDRRRRTASGTVTRDALSPESTPAATHHTHDDHGHPILLLSGGSVRGLVRFVPQVAGLRRAGDAANRGRRGTAAALRAGHRATNFCGVAASLGDALVRRGVDVLGLTDCGAAAGDSRMRTDCSGHPA